MLDTPLHPATVRLRGGRGGMQYQYIMHWALLAMLAMYTYCIHVMYLMISYVYTWWLGMYSCDVFNDLSIIHARISDPSTDAQHHILMILLTLLGGRDIRKKKDTCQQMALMLLNTEWAEESSSYRKWGKNQNSTTYQSYSVFSQLLWSQIAHWPKWKNGNV